MLPRSGKKKAMLKPTHSNSCQPYCPLSSSVPHYFTLDLTFLTRFFQSCSTAALTTVDKDGRGREAL